MTKTKDKTIRVRDKDYRRAKRLLRKYPGESEARWFMRFVEKNDK